MPADLKDRISRKIDSPEKNPRPAGAEPVRGEKVENVYRVRGGDYRILYQVRDQVLLVLILRVRPRDQVYKKR